MVKRQNLKWLLLFPFPLLAISCHKNDDNHVTMQEHTLTVQNILQANSLVESGTFQGQGSPPFIMPGQSVSFRFSAAPGQTVTFAAMYGFSNDLFFAPENPGIALYDKSNQPLAGDVSSQIRLWDNGTRINQPPGSSVNHPGTAESKAIQEVNGTDAQNNHYLPASDLVKATLVYEGASYFTLTLKNISGGTSNETPLSPGAWAISYIAGGKPLNSNPLYQKNHTSANGLTPLTEMGDNSQLYSYVKDNTGIFTPLSPVLVVVYNGIENPIFMTGMKDAGQGLKDLAQKGDASGLAASLKKMQGVKAVYVLPDPANTVLLPAIENQPGGMVSQKLEVAKGDKLAIATMYGFSNDWFFATKKNGIDATQTGNVSDSIGLFDDGTAVSQFPGAGNMQFNLGGTPGPESNPIQEVPDPNTFNTLPQIKDMIKVVLQ
jgi:hypothetical protein